MARKLRVQYPGAIYHAMNRGDRREPIFNDDQDRVLFLDTLAEACEKTDWQIHAWCQMGNHSPLIADRLCMGAPTHVASLLQRQSRKAPDCEETFSDPAPAPYESYGATVRWTRYARISELKFVSVT